MTAEDMFEVKDGELRCLRPYICARAGEEKARLDGDFTIEELVAITRWLQSHLPPLSPSEPTEDLTLVP